MANDINQMTFTGRLGADPESKVMPSGDAISNFSVACGKSWKDKASGEKRELTEWVRCVAFGKLADICNQYLKKGSRVAAVGEMRTRKWKDKDGNDRYTTEIVLDKLTMMSSADKGAAANDSAPAKREPEPAGKGLGDDDIPF